MKVKIAGAIATKTGVTLILKDGNEINLKNDSWRTKSIMDKVVPALARRESVVLDLDDFSIEKQIEKKSNGVVRFFRKAVKKVGELFSLEGPAPAPVEPEAHPELFAVVNGKEIPGVEALERQMENAILNDQVKGFTRFMERIASVVDKRGHSVQELLNFMKMADLPIADDGSIIAYKRLKSVGDHFRDCHTGKVQQRLGSLVMMAESLVDPSRRTECSNGLHIARRGYLRNFSGNVTTLVKIAPEDVIAVPHGEPNKMRVRAYHIIAHLPPEAVTLLDQNKPMTENPVASKMLADAISGNHIGIIETVEINGPQGADVVITPAGETAKAEKKAASMKEAKALDDERASVIDIGQIRETAEKAIAEKTAEKPAAAKKTKAPVKKSAPRKKPAAKKSAAPAPAKRELPETHRKALELLEQGLSHREINRQVSICRKTLRKLADRRAAGEI